MEIAKIVSRYLHYSAVVMLVAACVQYPTEKKEVADVRPSIVFSIAENMDATQYRVFVDNLDMGPLARYVSGAGALRLLSGSHIVRIETAGNAIFQESIYLGDGATRTLQVRAQ
jgi:hypothetical protein